MIFYSRCRYKTLFQEHRIWHDISDTFLRYCTFIIMSWSITSCHYTCTIIDKKIPMHIRVPLHWSERKIIRSIVIVSTFIRFELKQTCESCRLLKSHWIHDFFVEDCTNKWRHKPELQLYTCIISTRKFETHSLTNTNTRYIVISTEQVLYSLNIITIISEIPINANYITLAMLWHRQNMVFCWNLTHFRLGPNRRDQNQNVR